MLNFRGVYSFVVWEWVVSDPTKTSGVVLRIGVYYMDGAAYLAFSPSFQHHPSFSFRFQVSLGRKTSQDHHTLWRCANKNSSRENESHAACANTVDEWSKSDNKADNESLVSC